MEHIIKNMIEVNKETYYKFWKDLENTQIGLLDNIFPYIGIVKHFANVVATTVDGTSYKKGRLGNTKKLYFIKAQK